MGFDPVDYVLACANILDSIYAPHEDGKVTVLVDVRKIAGCQNVPAFKMVAFFRTAAAMLGNNYPERLKQVIVYPMPLVVTQFWRVVSEFMDRVTREKCILLHGSAALGAPCPEKLREYVSYEEIPADAQSMHAALKSLYVEDCVKVG